MYENNLNPAGMADFSPTCHPIRDSVCVCAFPGVSPRATDLASLRDWAVHTPLLHRTEGEAKADDAVLVARYDPVAAGGAAASAAGGPRAAADDAVGA